MRKDKLAIIQDEWRLRDVTDVKRYCAEGLMEFDNGAWNDIWPVVDYNPPCLECGHELMYNYGLDLFQCPRCGAWIFGSEYDYSELPSYDDVEAVKELYR